MTVDSLFVVEIFVPVAAKITVLTLTVGDDESFYVSGDTVGIKENFFWNTFITNNMSISSSKQILHRWKKHAW